MLSRRIWRQHHNRGLILEEKVWENTAPRAWCFRRSKSIFSKATSRVFALNLSRIQTRLTMEMGIDFEMKALSVLPKLAKRFKANTNSIILYTTLTQTLTFHLGSILKYAVSMTFWIKQQTKIQETSLRKKPDFRTILHLEKLPIYLQNIGIIRKKEQKKWNSTANRSGLWKKLALSWKKLESSWHNFASCFRIRALENWKVWYRKEMIFALIHRFRVKLVRVFRLI